jgi:putative membrane protein
VLLRAHMVQHLLLMSVVPPLLLLGRPVVPLLRGLPALTLRPRTLRDFEHVCFLASSVAFWWCIVRPWPTESRRNNWGWSLHFLSAALVNTAIAALLAF